MADISRVDLFGKLNRVGYQSIEAATVFCKMRGTRTSSRCIGFTRTCSPSIPTCTASFNTSS